MTAGSVGSLRAAADGGPSTRRQVALLVAGGLCLVPAFPPVDFVPAIFVGLVPIFYVLWRTPSMTFRGGFWRGLVAGIAFFLPLLHWLVFLSSQEMDNPVVMSGPLVLLVLLESFYWGLFGGSAAVVRRGARLPGAVALPVLWVAFEQLRSLGVLGFPWGAVGYACVPIPRAIQFASASGLFGVSYWVALVNAIVLTGITSASRRRLALGALALALAVPLAHGTMILSRAGGDDRPEMRVAVVQPNIPGKKKWDERFRSESFDVLEELSRRAADSDPDLIVWPETAAPSYLLREPSDLARVTETAREAGAAILTGFPDLAPDREDPSAYRYYNSVLLVSAEGEPGVKYDKIHLVPFGEVIPFETVFPFLKRVNFGEADFAPGRDRVVFEVDEGRFSALVCFESIFPRLARQFATAGSELFVNITNDVWYGRSGMPFQHASMAVMRCIENRRSLARSANSGVSLFADPYGRVIEETPIFESAVIVADLPLVAGTTFYSRRGDVFVWIVCALAGAMVLAALGGMRSRNRGNAGR